MTDPQQLRAIVAAWWEDTFVNDYVIDRSGNYRNAKDCIEDIVVRARAALAQSEPVVMGPSDGEPPPGPFSEHDLRQQWNQQADEFNQWDSLDSSEQLAWAQVRAIAADRAHWGNPAPAPGLNTIDPDWDVDRELVLAAPAPAGDHALRDADLACWGNPAPAPPADGEVAELVAELHNFVAAYKCCHNHDHIWSLSGSGINARLTVTLITRAAELLQRQVTVPVSVSERMPEPSTKVLAHYVNDLGKGRTICAIWVPAKSRSDEGGNDDFTEYDEEDDKFYWPEGWYEAIENWDELGYVKVYEGEVDYWQPLPRLPAHALPIPHQQETNNG